MVLSREDILETWLVIHKIPKERESQSNAPIYIVEIQIIIILVQQLEIDVFGIFYT